MSAATNPSPLRNPRGFDNAQFSHSHHASRDDLRNALEGNKVCFLEKDDGFWTKLLSIEAVSPAVTEALSQTIKPHINKLINLSQTKNPLESHMYPPLDSIFKALRNHTSSVTRVWKDHHTKYPGVDSGVLISGLTGKDPAATQDSSFSNKSGGRPPKRQRRNTSDPVYVPPIGNSDEEGSSDSDDFYQARIRKTPSSAPEDRRTFEARKPDYILLDVDSHGRFPQIPLWRQIAIIMELKPHSSTAPTTRAPESSLIVQCTDYARLHMALRPFQRFSIIFSLCGTVFTAWLVDRVGVIISDNVDIRTPEGVSTFIRALVQVTCNMNAYELGMDPTISLYGNSAMGDAEIPRFSVSMPSMKIYLTKGTPIWQSSSIFGRGTVVWNVEELPATQETGNRDSQAQEDTAMPTLILKNAYRNKERIGESEFYRAIQGGHIEGLAVFREGGDVYLNQKLTGSIGGKEEQTDDKNTPQKEHPSNKLVATSLHRAGLSSTFTGDSVTHRLVLESKGKRLVEYGSLLGLLKAILASVKGHEGLYNHGILHRDISIGNVFMSSPGQANPGFLADLDMAKVYDEEKLASLIGSEEASNLVKATTGSITGTAQFMSLPLSYEHSNAQDRKRLGPFPTSSVSTAAQFKRWMDPVPNQRPLMENSPRHDLESFIWVMFYALCAKEMNSKETPEAKEQYSKAYFSKIFGAVSFEETYQKHHHVRNRIVGCNPLDEGWRSGCISENVAWFVLEDTLRVARGETLTYESFQSILQHYIVQLEAKQPQPATD